MVLEPRHKELLFVRQHARVFRQLLRKLLQRCAQQGDGKQTGDDQRRKNNEDRGRWRNTTLLGPREVGRNNDRDKECKQQWINDRVRNRANAGEHNDHRSQGNDRFRPLILRAGYGGLDVGQKLSPLRE